MPKKNISIFLTLFSKSGSCALPFDFKLERGPKNIFYYQYEVESYTGLVLDFSLFDKREYTHGIFRSAILANMFTLGVYLMFSLFLKIWMIESILIFSEYLFRETCFLLASKIQRHKVFRWKQEVGDNLNVCVRNIFL